MEKLKKLLHGKTRNHYVQFIRYGVVSVAALIVDFGGLVLMKHFGHINYLLAGTISFIAGLLVNYVLSILWVFHSSRMINKRQEFIYFAAIGLVGLGLTDLILWALTSGLGIYYVISKAVATVVIYFWNFGMRKKYLFN